LADELGAAAALTEPVRLREPSSAAGMKFARVGSLCRLQADSSEIVKSVAPRMAILLVCMIGFSICATLIRTRLLPALKQPSTITVTRLSSRDCGL
jgi:hypothetical protein